MSLVSSCLVFFLRRVASYFWVLPIPSSLLCIKSICAMLCVVVQHGRREKFREETTKTTTTLSSSSSVGPSTPWTITGALSSVTSVSICFMFYYFLFRSLSHVAHSLACCKMRLPKHIIRTIAPCLLRGYDSARARHTHTHAVQSNLPTNRILSSRFSAFHGNPRTHVCALFIGIRLLLPLLSAFFRPASYFFFFCALMVDDVMRQHT